MLTTAEEPRGDTVFGDLLNDPPTSETEFIHLWKLYLISLIGKILQEYATDDPLAQELIKALEDAELIPRSGGLKALLRSVVAYVRRVPEALQVGMDLDQTTGLPSGFSGRIIFKDPTNSEVKRGFLGVDEMFRNANSIFVKMGASVWILLDRLDVAFADSAEMEANALRALFKTYRSLIPNSNISLKIFIRTDIWNRITQDQGFREASHITRTTTIAWTRPSLLNLALRRASQSEVLLDAAAVSFDEAIGNKQDVMLNYIFPDQVDSGPNKPKTFDWILSRTRDGSGQNAPRELIHFLESAREAEIRKKENNEPIDGTALLGRAALREALPVVSQIRLENTLYAEYASLRKYIDALIGEKSLQYLATLAKLWKIDLDASLKIADELTAIGLFERGGSKEEPEYKIPFLYRPALKIVQGTAEVDPGVEEQ